MELLLYNIFETSCSDEEGALLVVTSVAHCNLRLSYERMRGMLDVYGAAAQLCRGAQLLRCCAASLRPPAGRVSIRSRIGDRPPVGRVSIRSRIGDKHPAGRGSALRASRKVMPILSSVLERMGYSNLVCRDQPRVSGPSRGACAPWDGPSTLG